jgi:hypothetical protein
LESYVKTELKMDQRMIVACLTLKGLSARVMHENLTAALGSDAVADSSLRATFARRTFFPQVRTPLGPTFTGVLMIPTKPSCSLSMKTQLRLDGSSLD